MKTVLFDEGSRVCHVAVKQALSGGGSEVRDVRWCLPVWCSRRRRMFSRTGWASSVTTLERVAAEIPRSRLTGHAHRADIKRQVGPVVMSGSIVTVLFAAVADGEPVSAFKDS